jgi:ArsR family transcriptional regulator, arsenate/arsenite/antimonite-responsive transcriptional repressor
MDNATAVQIFASLAQESRLTLFRLLVQASPGGLAAGEIATQLGVPSSTLSFHLKELTYAGLVYARQAGRFIYYSVDFARMNALIGFMMENCCGGRQDCCNPISSTKENKP